MVTVILCTSSLQLSCTTFTLSLHSVKFISYILSIYMLALSLVPCSDGMDFMHSDCDTDTEVVDNSHNHSDHDHEDLCTPFCICACCGSMAMIPTTIDYSGSYAKVPTLCLHNYQSNYSFDYSKGVWHPPTLS